MNLPEINVQEARKRLESGEGYVYLDVRTVEEFAQGHAPGAINIPVAFRNAATGRMEPNPNFVAEVERVLEHDRKIICGCRSGGRSATAQDLLSRDGFTGAINMMGGFHGKTDMAGQLLAPGWSTLGYPLCTHGAAGCKCYEGGKE
ncbi:MAG: rhodanese-like domain-containing protein [Phycisphaerales bacterium]|nr:rhodanese-like domain-containing protein [Phycisphaerales bacterium]